MRRTTSGTSGIPAIPAAAPGSAPQPFVDSATPAAPPAWTPPAAPAAAPPTAPPAAPPVAPPAATPPVTDLGSQMQGMLASAGRPGGGSGGGLGAIDMSGVSSGGGGRLLPTEHPCEFEIVKAEMKASKAANQMLALELVCTFPVEYAGVKVYDQCVLTPNSLWKFKGLCEACDLLAEDGATFSGSGPNDFVGCIVEARVYHDEYPAKSGKMKNKLDGGFSAATRTPGIAGPTGVPDWTPTS